MVVFLLTLNLDFEFILILVLFNNLIESLFFCLCVLIMLNTRFKVNVYSVVAYWLYFDCFILSSILSMLSGILFARCQYTTWRKLIFTITKKKPTSNIPRELNLANLARRTFCRLPYKRCLQR